MTGMQCTSTSGVSARGSVGQKRWIPRLAMAAPTSKSQLKSPAPVITSAAESKRRTRSMGTPSTR